MTPLQSLRADYGATLPEPLMQRLTDADLQALSAAGYDKVAHLVLATEAGLNAALSAQLQPTLVPDLLSFYKLNVCVTANPDFIDSG